MDHPGLFRPVQWSQPRSYSAAQQAGIEVHCWGRDVQVCKSPKASPEGANAPTPATMAGMCGERLLLRSLGLVVAASSLSGALAPHSVFITFHHHAARWGREARAPCTRRFSRLGPLPVQQAEPPHPPHMRAGVTSHGGSQRPAADGALEEVLVASSLSAPHSLLPREACHRSSEMQLIGRRQWGAVQKSSWCRQQQPRPRDTSGQNCRLCGRGVGHTQ